MFLIYKIDVPGLNIEYLNGTSILKIIVKHYVILANNVIIIGDMNVAHYPIDLHEPERNIWSAGFTFYERSSFTQLLKAGFNDTYRELYNDKVQYTWWSTRNKTLRQRNLGWRIDYSLVDDDLMLAVEDSEIHDQVMGSDH